MVKVGDRLPPGSFRVKGDDGTVKQVSSDELFAGQKVVLVGVPGAFTSTCHNAHIPTFVANVDTLKRKGIDRIAVMAVNDHHVMKEWGKALGADGRIDFLADGSVVYTRALDLINDQTDGGLGIRCKRFAMIVDDGVVKWMSLEPPGGKIVETGAAAVLAQL
jgi:glutaredoxin/glutathione-dependent peroxiredoxin